MENRNQYVWLDFIRGLSALAVFIGHLRIICFHDGKETAGLDIYSKIIFFLTGFGHLAVVIFFALSGFLIIKSIHEAVLKNKWNALHYAQDRLFRLWVVLIPALVLGLVLDRIGIAYWGDSLFYSNRWKYFLNQDIENKLTAVIFFGNVFFVQKILVPTLGSNGALWSLANEFWYYVVFPLFYFTAINWYKLIYRVVFFIAAILLLVFVGKQIALSFPIWLMGGLSYIITKTVDEKHLKRKELLFLFSLLFVVFLVLCRLKFHEEIFNSYSVSFVFAIAIPFLCKAQMKSNILKSVSSFFSDISYTLYLAHLPFIYLVTSILGFQDRTWSYKYFMLYLGLVVLTLLYSALLWFLFEKNTKKIKWRIIGRGRGHFIS